MIRVLLVDDSSIALTILARMLSHAPEIVVAGTARNGREALRLIPTLKPHVVCTDLEMPEMNGFEFIDAVMRTAPCPILVISNYVEARHAHNAFRALELGAIDIFPKPRGGSDASPADAEQLVQKVRVLSGVVPFRRRGPAASAYVPSAVPAVRQPVRVVVIGASTGGPQALQTIFGALPVSLPVPILCVQHINAAFHRSFVAWLQRSTGRAVSIIAEGEPPAPGHIYFPREDQHMLLDARGRLVSARTAAFDGHRPSISATFLSAARFFGAATMGVLLTGMGRDGADGLKAIAEAGGITVAQDEASSIVFGMAKQAIDVGAATHVLPLPRIAEAIVRATGSRTTKP